MATLTLLQGDCLEQMATIPDGSVDLVLCDLPYGVTNNKWDSEIPLDALWRHWHRVSKPETAFVLFGQGMFTAKLMMSNPSEWRYNLVWDKVLTTGFLNASRMPMKVHEDIAVFYGRQPTYHPQTTTGAAAHRRGRFFLQNGRTSSNYGDYAPTESKETTEKQPVSILTFPKPHPSVAVHPTQKSEALLRYLVRTYSNPGDTVLDSTMGSGTTGLACLEEGRAFIGIEKEPAYFRTAEELLRRKEADIRSRLF